MPARVYISTSALIEYQFTVNMARFCAKQVVQFMDEMDSESEQSETDSVTLKLRVRV